MNKCGVDAGMLDAERSFGRGTRSQGHVKVAALGRQVTPLAVRPKEDDQAAFFDELRPPLNLNSRGNVLLGKRRRWSASRLRPISRWGQFLRIAPGYQRDLLSTTLINTKAIDGRDQFGERIIERVLDRISEHPVVADCCPQPAIEVGPSDGSPGAWVGEHTSGPRWGSRTAFHPIATQTNREWNAINVVGFVCCCPRLEEACNPLGCQEAIVSETTLVSQHGK